MEGRPSTGAIAPVKGGMPFRALLESEEGVVGTDQTQRGAGSYRGGMITGLAGLVPTDVIVQIPCHDRGAFSQKARKCAERQQGRSEGGNPDWCCSVVRPQCDKIESIRPQYS